MRTFCLGLVLAALPLSAASQAANVEPPPGTIVHRDVPYVAHGHARQVLDLYLPAGASAPSPLILLIHGGAWRQGDKATNRGVAALVPVLLDAGYAVASMNHRYSSQALFPAQIHDAKAAVRWVRANQTRHEVDGSRIGVWGGSSGGHLAALLGTSAGVPSMDGDLGDVDQSTRVNAVVAWYPPTQFLEMDAQRLPDGWVHNAPDSPESQLLGGPVQERADAALAASPLTYVSSDDPPFLLLHGDADRLVPFQQSLILRDALSAAGVAVDLRILPGAGHGLADFLNQEVIRLVVQFFNQYVRDS